MVLETLVRLFQIIWKLLCGDKHSIVIKEIQRQGKKPQNIGEFIPGSQIKKGAVV